MRSDDIYQALTEIFRDIFDDDELALSPKTNATDVPEWDSFNHVNILVAAEQRFGIKFKIAEINELENVGDFVQLIQDKLGKV